MTNANNVFVAIKLIITIAVDVRSTIGINGKYNKRKKLTGKKCNALVLFICQNSIVGRINNLPTKYFLLLTVYGYTL